MIRLSFSWVTDHEASRPACECDSVNCDGISLLECLLMDDGGCGNQQSVAWLDEGLRRISHLEFGIITQVDWCRETWGAQMTTHAVKLFSLHDESYAQTMPLIQFKAALLAWKDFLQSSPLPDRKVLIDI